MSLTGRQSKLKYDVELALAHQRDLMTKLGDMKRHIQRLRKECDHPEKVTDSDDIVTCTVCQAIIPGDIEWLK